jgi:hypothetical protein
MLNAPKSVRSSGPIGARELTSLHLHARPFRYEYQKVNLSKSVDLLEYWNTYFQDTFHFTQLDMSECSRYSVPEMPNLRSGVKVG